MWQAGNVVERRFEGWRPASDDIPNTAADLPGYYSEDAAIGWLLTGSSSDSKEADGPASHVNHGVLFVKAAFLT